MCCYPKTGIDGSITSLNLKKLSAFMPSSAKRLGYRRNNAAASLRSGRTHSIAVIVSDIANPFFAEICRNIENIAYKDGFTVIFASSEENPQKLAHLVETMVGYSVEGLIVAPCIGAEAALARAVNIGIPTVLIDRNMPGEVFSSSETLSSIIF